MSRTLTKESKLAKAFSVMLSLESLVTRLENNLGRLDQYRMQVGAGHLLQLQRQEVKSLDADTRYLREVLQASEPEAP